MACLSSQDPFEPMFYGKFKDSLPNLDLKVKQSSEDRSIQIQYAYLLVKVILSRRMVNIDIPKVTLNR